jgi:hypothetical protein
MSAHHRYVKHTHMARAERIGIVYLTGTNQSVLVWNKKDRKSNTRTTVHKTGTFTLASLQSVLSCVCDFLNFCFSYMHVKSVFVEFDCFLSLRSFRNLVRTYRSRIDSSGFISSESTNGESVPLKKNEKEVSVRQAGSGLQCSSHLSDLHSAMQPAGRPPRR